MSDESARFTKIASPFRVFTPRLYGVVVDEELGDEVYVAPCATLADADALERVTRARRAAKAALKAAAKVSGVSWSRLRKGRNRVCAWCGELRSLTSFRRGAKVCKTCAKPLKRKGSRRAKRTRKMQG